MPSRTAAARLAAAIVVAALLGALLACADGQPSAGSDPLAAISRLTRVHDYPMYLLDYQGDYRLAERLRVSDTRGPVSRVPGTSAWACTAFAAFGDGTRPASRSPRGGTSRGRWRGA